MPIGNRLHFQSFFSAWANNKIFEKAEHEKKINKKCLELKLRDKKLNCMTNIYTIVKLFFLLKVKYNH